MLAVTFKKKPEEHTQLLLEGIKLRVELQDVQTEKLEQPAQSIEHEKQPTTTPLS